MTLSLWRLSQFCSSAASGWLEGGGAFVLDPIGCFALSQRDVESGAVAGCDFVFLDEGFFAVALFVARCVVHDGLSDLAGESDVVC